MVVLFYGALSASSPARIKEQCLQIPPHPALLEREHPAHGALLEEFLILHCLFRPLCATLPFPPSHSLHLCEVTGVRVSDPSPAFTSNTCDHSDAGSTLHSSSGVCVCRNIWMHSTSRIIYCAIDNMCCTHTKCSICY